MRWRTLLWLVTFPVILLSGCGGGEPEKINGLGPSDIPVKYTEARIQKDYETVNDLLQFKEDDLLDLQGEPNETKLETYGLTEWKLDDETFFYLLEYLDPSENNNLHTANFKIIKTEEGWKKERYGETADFDVIVAKLEKNVLRELSSS